MSIGVVLGWGGFALLVVSHAMVWDRLRILGAGLLAIGLTLMAVGA